ncbi:hypothetical protein M8C21_010037 [Ambrosia artemisiifolia]|uniref:Uncharacterized protein n=1 Tax=Ambrosia artemisiifolia TaxID=4212 RepID=A0AAD5GJ73_AMBAR|nr:hypothetical protein M8C21_010037 [Ambrosia artemisiifolia]
MLGFRIRAIVALKEESVVLKNSSNEQRDVEEFIPLENNFDDVDYSDDAKVETF